MAAFSRSTFVDLMIPVSINNNPIFIVFSKECNVDFSSSQGLQCTLIYCSVHHLRKNIKSESLVKATSKITLIFWHQLLKTRNCF